jgi:glycosyltransferase involved in cell wall biosynthesis
MDNRISIIVPVFNIENYVERCIHSLLNQTCANIEIITVDDGSTDSSGEILDRIAAGDSRVKVIHKPNGGVTSARLRGVKEASGQWIGFVDGDDEVEPDMFEHLLDNAITYNAEISHCGYQMVFPGGRIDYYYNTGVLVKQDKVTALKELLSGERIEPGLCNKLFRRTLFDSLLQGDAVPHDIKINEDLLMNYLLFKQAEQTVYEDICPYHYLLHKGSAATTKKRHHVTDPLRVNELIRNDLKGDTRLYPTAYSRCVHTLIGTAVQKQWREESHAATKQLRSEFFSKEIANCPSVKTRLMAFGAGFMPHLYCLVRRVYDRMTGVSKKYDF